MKIWLLLICIPCHVVAAGTCAIWEFSLDGNCFACNDGWVTDPSGLNCDPCLDGYVRGNAAGTGLTSCVSGSGICSPSQEAKGGKCKECAADMDSTNALSCVPCPDGQVRGNANGTQTGVGCSSASEICSPSQRATGGKCEECAAGREGGSTAALSCVPCPDGKVRGNADGTQIGVGCSSASGICQPYQKATGGKCVDCAAGLVGATTNFAFCAACPDGQVRGNSAGTGTSGCVQANNICLKGEKANGGKCVACTANQVANTGYTVCTVCADGTVYSSPTAGCIAALGTCSVAEKATGGSCVACPNGFVANPGYTACVACSDGQVRGNSAGDADSGCVQANGICLKGEKATGGRCAACPATEVANAGYTDCADCANGTVYTSPTAGCVAASGVCSVAEKATGGSCVACPNGFVANSGYTDCVACSDGQVRGNSTGDANSGCVQANGICLKGEKATGGRCAACPATQVANAGYTACADCADGTVYSNPTAGCVTATGVCSASQKATGGSCVTCANGFVANAAFTDCEVCSDGQVRGNSAGDLDGGSCVGASGICAKSQKASGGKCVTCSDGFEPNTGYTDCVVCVDGKVRGNRDGNATTECQAASGICYESQKATGGKCSTCPDGFEATSDFTDCVVCVDGKVRGNPDGSAATECQGASGICAKSQKATGGKCVTCPDGYEATSDYTDCVVCVDGKVRGSSDGSAATECQDASSYCLKSQKATGGICVDCDDGFEANIDYTDCIVCVDGKVRGNPDGSANTECQAASGICLESQKASGGKCVTCPDGFAASSDYTGCIVCPNGTVRGNPDGSAPTGCQAASTICSVGQKGTGGKCVTCDDGSVANSAYTDCAVCAPGSVRGNANGTASTGCVAASGICGSNQKAVGGKCVSCPSGLLATQDFTDCCKRTKVKGTYVCLVPKKVCGKNQKLVKGKCVPKKRLLRDIR